MCSAEKVTFGMSVITSWSCSHKLSGTIVVLLQQNCLIRRKYLFETVFCLTVFSRMSTKNLICWVGIKQQSIKNIMTVWPGIFAFSGTKKDCSSTIYLGKFCNFCIVYFSGLVSTIKDKAQLFTTWLSLNCTQRYVLITYLTQSKLYTEVCITNLFKILLDKITLIYFLQFT